MFIPQVFYTFSTSFGPIYLKNYTALFSYIQTNTARRPILSKSFPHFPHFIIIIILFSIYKKKNDIYNIMREREGG